MAEKKGKSGSGAKRGRKVADSGKTGRDKDFAAILGSLIPRPSGQPASGTTLQGAPLAHLEYSRELEAKNRALQLFWESHGLPGALEPVLASPRPRNYRTTSSRRAARRGPNLQLLLAGERRQKEPFLASPLEPESHTRIYRFLQAKISEPAFRLVARHLNHLIIRGSYAELAVIFNVDTMYGPLVRKLKLLGEHLRNLDEPVEAAFIYPDPSTSPYYLEASRPPKMPSLKRLFGRQRLMVSHQGHRYLFHPTSFCQVNESAVPALLDTARSLLQPGQEERLIDLYCGFGLFSHYLAADYRQVTGVEAEKPSVEAARANARLASNSDGTRFRQGEITARNLDKLLPQPDPLREAIILDPPRQGPKEGVIPALCRREPGKVLHIHCNANLLPQSIREWGEGGYRPSRLVPLDMFPGTDGLEVLLLLEREGSGVGTGPAA